MMVAGGTGQGNSAMSIAGLDIAIAHTEELFADDLGQMWCPATVSVTWPPVDEFPAPSIAVKVIAPARADMTLDDLKSLHLRAAHDVLNAALLGIEQIVERRDRPVRARRATKPAQ